MGKVEWFSEIADKLRDYPGGDVWSSCGDILCKTESAAAAIADLLWQLYRSQDEDVIISTGYYDPEEDERNGEQDRFTGWWYVNIT